MCVPNPVRSVRGFLSIKPTKFINVHRPVLLVLTPSSRSGYTCTHQHSPGCHCPVTSNQQHEPLLTSSLAMSMILFILEYIPLVTPKALYLSMESILIPILRYVKTSLSACTVTELTSVHFSSWNCTPVLFPRIQSYFSIAQLENLNCIIDWNISISNSTSTSTGWMM